MKEKFIHNSFFCYLRCFFWGVPTDARSVSARRGSLVIILSTIALGYVLGYAEIDTISLPLSMFIILSWAAICAVAELVRRRPSLLNMLPISWPKRVIYFILGSFIYMLMIILVILAIVIVTLLLVSAVVLICTGEWIFVIEATEEEEIIADSTVPYAITGQGIMLYFAVFATELGAALSIGNITITKVRNILSFAFSIALAIPLVLIKLAVQTYSPQYMSLAQVPFSWLYASLFLAVGLAALGYGIYRLITYLSPKNY